MLSAWDDCHRPVGVVTITELAEITRLSRSSVRHRLRKAGISQLDYGADRRFHWFDFRAVQHLFKRVE
jgi:DNA-binding transcriptional regulator GbsR (MarR family)